MKYDITGGNFPAVICTLEPGESMSTQGGGMVWMTPNMKMQTEGGGGLGKAFGRMMTGEKFFRNTYTAQGGSGMIAFASSFPGSIAAIEVTPQRPIIVQKGAFLCGTMGIDTEIYFKKSLGAGFFGGEGFIMQRIYGNGMVFLEVDGSAVSYDLGPGETMIVDTGNLVMMDSTCTMDIEKVKGVKNVLFGGEGLFNTVVTGPGRITLQTMTVNEFASKLAPFIAPHISSKS